MPDKIALIYQDQKLTYQQLLQIVDLWHDQLDRNNYRTIAYLLHDKLQLLTIFIAASHLGLNSQILNPDWPIAQQQKTYDFLKPDAIISDQRQQLQNIKNLYQTDQTFSYYSATPASISRQEIGFYTGFTSGSTGGPKGFVRTEQSWIDSFISEQKAFSLTINDTIFSPGHLAHSLFLYAAIRGLYLGATVVLADSTRADKLTRLIEKHDTTIIYVTPIQIRQILDFAHANNMTLPNLNKVLSSGSKFPLNWLDECRSILPNAEIFEFYGTSELSFISSKKITQTEGWSNVGHIFDGVDIKISPLLKTSKNGDGISNGSTNPKIGKIQIKSKFAFLGYATERGQPSLKSCDIDAGYISIGDAGYLDGQDMLHLVGRTDRMFLSNGRNIYPEEIEAVMLKHPDIVNCAVFPRPHPTKENIIEAVIKVENESLTRQDLSGFCRSYLALYNLPKNYYFLKNWPKTVSDKSDLTLIKSLLDQEKLELL